MPTVPERNTGLAVQAVEPNPIAFTIQVARNMVVQGLGMAMVSVMGLTILPWPIVLAWILVALGTVVAEDRLLRFIAGGGRYSGAASAWARLASPPCRLLCPARIKRLGCSSPAVTACSARTSARAWSPPEKAAPTS